jgi:hypothetical protein
MLHGGENIFDEREKSGQNGFGWLFETVAYIYKDHKCLLFYEYKH